jgi:hypothetical protein
MKDLNDREAERYISPGTLQRLVIEGVNHLMTGRYKEDLSEWAWALQYLRWAALLEAFSSPPIYVGDLCGGLWHDGPQGRKLCRTAVRSLRRRGLLRTKRRGRILYPAGEPWSLIRPLWRWLLVHWPRG